MRRKIVLWGSNEQEEKLLVALELLEKENMVIIYTFPEKIATEEFYKKMSADWKDDKEVDFPDGYQKIERKLSVSESLLPDEIRVERTDVVTRAQAEWHFVVLSSKLYDLYKSELEEIKEKVDNIASYDNAIWNDLKEFWNKVQGQVNERNLFREHGAALREKTNLLFDKLKELRQVVEEKFEEQSAKLVKEVQEELDSISEKIESGLGLSPLFEDLKTLQAKARKFKLTKEHRNEIWASIDSAFKTIKEKRGARGGADQANSVSRLQNRYNGLLSAIQKMEKSVNFDKNELDFQAKRVDRSEGQLEMQLRQAKIKMVEERLSSKSEKLADMLKTKAELESKIEKESKKAIKYEREAKVEEAKNIVKQKIAAEIDEQAKELQEEAEKLEKAAENIKESKKPSILSAITESIENLVEDVVDTAKAVAIVAEDKLEDMMDAAEDVAEGIEDKVEKWADQLEDKIEDVIDKVKEKTQKDKSEEE